MTTNSTILSNTTEEPLIQTVSEIIGEGAQSVSLAVGYLFVEGMAPILPALQNVRSARILIGNVVNKLSETEIKAEQSTKISASVHGDEDAFATSMRQERDRVATVTALNLRQTIADLPHTQQINTCLTELASLIASGKLQVRVYTAGRLHAKLTIIGFPPESYNAPGLAIVGSSNLTLPPDPSNESLNCDLDILMGGKKNFDRLNQWFEKYWSDAQDFRKELFEELARRWPNEAISL
jgi:hypothetical protein